MVYRVTLMLLLRRVHSKVECRVIERVRVLKHPNTKILRTLHPELKASRKQATQDKNGNRPQNRMANRRQGLGSAGSAQERGPDGRTPTVKLGTKRSIWAGNEGCRTRKYSPWRH